MRECKRNLLEWSNLNMTTYLQQIAYATDIYNIERDDRLDFFRSKIHYAKTDSNDYRNQIETETERESIVWLKMHELTR